MIWVNLFAHFRINIKFSCQASLPTFQGSPPIHSQNLSWCIHPFYLILYSDSVRFARDLFQQKTSTVENATAVHLRYFCNDNNFAIFLINLKIILIHLLTIILHIFRMVVSISIVTSVKNVSNQVHTIILFYYSSIY